MKQIYLLLFTLIAFSSCATSQGISPMNYKKQQLVFGNGGGFAGTTNSYVLLQNGGLYQQNNDTTYIEIGEIEKKDCKAIFKEYKKIKADTVDINNPGNMYYFVEFIKKDTAHKVVWGGGETPPDTLKTFYSDLMEIVKTAKTENAESENDETDKTNNDER